MASSDFIIEDGVLKKYDGHDTNVTIPLGVREIGVRAFSTQKNITEITIPSSVKTIKSFAFSSCHNLKSVTFPLSVERIEDMIFSGCENLDSVTITNPNVDINISAFNNCTVKNINIPENVNLNKHNIDISTTINNKRQVGRAVSRTILIII